MRRVAWVVGVVLTCAGCGADATSQLDPNQQWLLAVSSASVKATNNGTAWDGDGSGPGVFAQFHVGDVVTGSTTVQDHYSPVWYPAEGVVVTTAMLTASGVSPVTVQFWDEDLMIDDTVTDPQTLVFTEDEIRSGVVVFGATGGLNSATFLITPY